MEEYQHTTMNLVKAAQASIEELNTVTDDLEKKLLDVEKASAPSNVLDALKDRFEAFAEIENIRKLERIYLPKIAGFKNLVDELEASHDQMRQCIRRFDEDLSLKAGKDALLL